MNTEERFKFIMYLDFDGVITPSDYIMEMHKKLVGDEKSDEGLHYRNFNQRYCFSYNAVKFLNDLYDKCPYVIVMTTTRRFEHSVKEWRFIFKMNGIKPDIIDRTKFIKAWREEEIVEYQKRNTVFSISKIPYIIVDDDSFDLKSLEDKLLLVNTKTGLVDKDMEKAVKILKAQGLELK